MVAYLVDSATSTIPPVLSLQFANLLRSQNSAADTDVSFCEIEGHSDKFCAGVPIPKNEPYWKTPVPCTARM